ncbi:MAG: tRNA preQ1(34) S-adenosylmethionine ribosyltransferase-isomerase QueA [Halanaerobiales bacterium]
MNNKKLDIYNKQTYDYNLPEELIAQEPAKPRDNSRLLIYNRKLDTVKHKRFRNIINHLNEGDVLVINSTKVLPARLFARKEKTEGKVEILLLKRVELDLWEILIKPAKKVKEGTELVFSEQLRGVIQKKKDEGKALINFQYQGVFENIIKKIGHMPLPHYIKKELKNNSDYQTIYAKKSGSSAAPTAGLHFTEELMDKLRKKGINILEVTLHVGLGTFRPVKENNIKNHNMHSEFYSISKDVADKINAAKKRNKNIVAVGTTVIRTLESATNSNGEVIAGENNTDIFIYPGYKFKTVDKLITNFHLPQSTLIMLVSAMIGIDKTMELYNLAVKQRYRFFSFGDAMFIE